MRNSKRVLLSVVCFVLVFALFAALSLGIYYGSETLAIMDSRVRASLAGSLDRLMIGSSHAWNGFMPAVFDVRLHSSSYNLSGGVFPMYAKNYFLQKELERNPLKIVYIEISDDTLTRTNEHDYAEGDEIAIARLDSWGERLTYMKRFLSFNDCVNVYSRALLRGGQAAVAILQGKSTLDHAARGYYGKDGTDVSLSHEEAEREHNVDKITPADYREENIEGLTTLIKTCRDAGIQPVIVVMPVSDTHLWKTEGEEEFRLWIENYGREQNCPVYDFNLLRERYELFSDKTSFRDGGHLSKRGAETFTTVFAELMEKAEQGGEISDRVFDSYDELLQASPYQP